MKAMRRRDWLKLSASAALTSVSGTAQELTHDATRGASAAEWKPDVFDAHQNETVIALSDLILPGTDTPGAKAARVNQYIDLLLRDGPAEQRELFLQGLGWMDGYARGRFGHPFIGCSRDQQTQLLTTLASAGGEVGEPGQRFFRTAKDMIAKIYYSTEIGYRELNKGGRVPAAFGCAG